MKDSNLMNLFLDLYPLVAALVSMFVSQIIKIIYFYLKNNKMDFRKMMTSGGLPSSHSALVAALTTSVGLQEGWVSPLFSACVVFSLIVIYDAAGVRRAVGKQAEVLNHIIDDYVQRGEFKSQKMTQLLGHTPFEVLVGILLGIGIAFTLFY
jgi:uncharacterized protein